jgi:small subunit ribosomal protein S13
VLHANINHHRNVGTYRGRRHAAHLPVRGQRTSTNANTAKKLNRLERRGFASQATQATQARPESSQTSLKELLEPLARIRFAQQ